MTLGEDTPLLGSAQRLLNQINIRFIDTTFTYTDLRNSSPPGGNAEEPGPSSQRPNLLERAAAKIRDKAEIATRHTGEIAKGKCPEKRLQNCIFPGTPGGEKTRVKNYIAKFPSKPMLTFINCNFVNRDQTLWEKVSRWIMNTFCGGGTDFTLVQDGNSVFCQVDGGTFVLSTVPEIVRKIMQRVQEPSVLDV